MVFRKECFEEASAFINSGFNYVSLLNLILGGLIGIIVDMTSGGGFDLDPDDVFVTLEPIQNCTPRP